MKTHDLEVLKCRHDAKGVRRHLSDSDITLRAIVLLSEPFAELLCREPQGTEWAEWWTEALCLSATVQEVIGLEERIVEKLEP